MSSGISTWKFHGGAMVLLGTAPASRFFTRLLLDESLSDKCPNNLVIDLSYCSCYSYGIAKTCKDVSRTRRSALSFVIVVQDR